MPDAPHPLDEGRPSQSARHGPLGERALPKGRGGEGDKARVLVVEDNGRSLQLLRDLLTQEGYEVSTAADGEEALARIGEKKPDCVLCDLVMPKMDGYEVVRRMKGLEETRLIPIIVVTGLADLSHKLTAIEAGADDFLTKPYNVLEVTARVRSLVRMKRLNDALESASNVVFALARAIEAKDNYTQGHGERVAEYAVLLALHVGLPRNEIDAVRKGGVLHDVGKIGCPDAILNKPGPLTADEFEIVKRHPTHGWDICQHLKSVADALPCIRWHHEKLDGSGYPDALGGNEIPLPVRIMSIADVYDALATARAYKPAFAPETCFRILREESERGWWDKDLVKAFTEMMEEKHSREGIPSNLADAKAGHAKTA
ncbi:response regulator [bacterium]|nr:response regulator [bacterium]